MASRPAAGATLPLLIAACQKAEYSSAICSKRGDQQLFLGLEVEIDDARRQAGLGRDMGQRRIGIADPPDRANCRIYQLLTADFLDGFGLGHWRFNPFRCYARESR